MKIYLWGLMGSGKSYLGKQLADVLGWTFCDLDADIETAEGRTISTIFEKSGSDYFRDAERDALLKTKFAHQTVVATGGGAPCFFDNADFMLTEGTCVWLYTPMSVIIERLWEGENEHRPLLKGRSRTESAELLGNLLAKRHPIYSRAHHSVRSDAKEVISLLKSLI